MKLIYIVGKKRSGKDTAVDFINSEYNVHKYQLAGPIKDALSHACQVSRLHEIPGMPTRPLTREDWEGEGIDRETKFPLSNAMAAEIINAAVSFLIKNHGLKPTDKTLHAMQISNIVERTVLNNTEAWSMRRFMQTLGTDVVVNKLDRMFWMKLFANEFIDHFEDKKLDFFVVPDTRQDHELSFARAMGATVVHVVRDSIDSQDDHITEKGLPIGPNDVVITNDDTLESFKTKITQVFETL